MDMDERNIRALFELECHLTKIKTIYVKLSNPELMSNITQLERFESEINEHGRAIKHLVDVLWPD